MAKLGSVESPCSRTRADARLDCGQCARQPAAIDERPVTVEGFERVSEDVVGQSDGEQTDAEIELPASHRQFECVTGVNVKDEPVNFWRGPAV